MKRHFFKTLCRVYLRFAALLHEHTIWEFTNVAADMNESCIATPRNTHIPAVAALLHQHTVRESKNVAAHINESYMNASSTL